MSRPGWAAPRGLLFMLCALSLWMTSACGEGTPRAGERSGPLLEGPFVAVSRELSAESWERLRLGLGVTPETRNAEGNGTFYLALRKKELGQRWFLSAFVKQDAPAELFGNVVYSLGVSVVSFQVQNGKLYAFDVDDTKVRSELFKPDEVLEAWPIITDDASFNRLPNSDDYILFDPAAGLDRFMGSDDLGQAYGGSFEVELAFARRFRKLSTGVAFEKVITGHSLGIFADLDIPARVTATLSVELKRYQEDAAFTTPPAPPLTHYFLSKPRYIPNTGGLTEQVPIKWNLRPGMKPITWVISDTLVKAQQDPRYSDYDLVGAVKKGVEHWNEAFGFQALSARVVQPGESVGDQELNSIFFDPDPSYTTAWADFRSNPNNGEILGANVYLPIAWLDAAVAAGGAAPATAPGGTPRSRLRLSWNGMTPERRCELDVSEALGASDATVSPLAGTLPPLTPKERVERIFTDVVMHEIGHTLGLRHNFKGSLVFPSSSVMEYIYMPEQAYRGGGVGPYDVAAIHYLYGMSSSLPEEAFCTDEDTYLDVDCNRRDTTSNPLELFYAPTYRTQLRAALETGGMPPTDATLNSVLQYLRAGRSSQEKMLAWNIAMEGLLAPIPPETLAAFPGYGARADTQARRVLRRLYLDNVIVRGIFISADPRPNPLFTPALLEQLRGNLLNVDGVRTRATRSSAIDILKKLQTYEAYTVLLEARGLIEASLPGLSGQARLDAQDLVSRLVQATSPYFN